LAKVTGANQFSLVMGHQTTAEVDDCNNYTTDPIIFLSGAIFLPADYVVRELG
jgi:hypothetical protein